MTSPELCLDWIDQGGNATIPAPKIAICLLTWKRTEMAVRTVIGLCEFLDYPKELRCWYVADDGSQAGHLKEIFRELENHQEEVIGYHSDRFRSGRTPNCGKGWNMAMTRAHQYTDYILWMEDDWELREKFDLRPYVRLLVEKQDVGLIRFGTVGKGNNVYTCGHNGIHYIDYLRSTHYAYSGNPSISHKRFWDAYGKFPIDRNPGEMELHIDWSFRVGVGRGPSIWRPLNISPWGSFHHIGQERTFE